MRCRPRRVGGAAYPCTVYGELVRKGGKWMTDAPRSCPNGHPLGPGQVLVGHVACLGHGGGGHTTWHCRTCDATVSGRHSQHTAPRSKGLQLCGSRPDAIIERAVLRRNLPASSGPSVAFVRA